MAAATRKKVAQYDLQGHLIATYISETEASKKTGIGIKNINKVCKGHGNTAGGFIWKIIQEGSTTMSEENPSSTAQNAETSDDIV